MLADDFRFLFRNNELLLVLIDTNNGSSVCTRLADTITHHLATSLTDIVTAQQRQLSNADAAN